MDKSIALPTTADHGFESWFSRLDLGLNYRPGDMVLACKATTGWDSDYLNAYVALTWPMSFFRPVGMRE